MLHRVNDLKGLQVLAQDGVVGSVKDAHFDDLTWTVRYLVVETGSWLNSRRILISPLAIETDDWPHGRIRTSLSRFQIATSPSIDTDMPVSRQHEAQHLNHYRFPHYWEQGGFGGQGRYPGNTPASVGYRGACGAGRREIAEDNRLSEIADRQQQQQDGQRLRSCSRVIDHEVHAVDGEIGRVTDFLFDEVTWSIRYMVIDTGPWWSGHEVLVDPQVMVRHRWDESCVFVSLSRDFLKHQPVYHDVKPAH